MMDVIKPLLLAPMIAAAFAAPSMAARSHPAGPTRDCLRPDKLLSALTTAGDWIIKRDPVGVTDEKLTGLVFRDAGMINVALFQQGCLAAVVVVGKSPPDIKV